MPRRERALGKLALLAGRGLRRTQLLQAGDRALAVSEHRLHAPAVLSREPLHPLEPLFEPVEPRVRVGGVAVVAFDARAPVGVVEAVRVAPQLAREVGGIDRERAQPLGERVQARVDAGYRLQSRYGASERLRSRPRVRILARVERLGRGRRGSAKLADAAQSVARADQKLMRIEVGLRGVDLRELV